MINGIENKQTNKKKTNIKQKTISTKLKFGYLKIDKPLARLLMEKRRYELQILGMKSRHHYGSSRHKSNKTRIILHTTGIQLYVNKFEDLEEINKFFKKLKQICF